MYIREAHALAKVNYELEFNPLTVHQVTPDQQRVNRHRYTTTLNRLHAVNDSLSLMEDEFGIGVRWLPNSDEFKEAQVLIRERRYRRALDNLERLVVQRLFELSKLGMSGLGT